MPLCPVPVQSGRSPLSQYIGMIALLKNVAVAAPPAKTSSYNQPASVLLDDQSASPWNTAAA